MQSLPDGLAVIVKRDCPTCVMVEPVLRQLAAAGKITIVSQDDPAFPSGAGAVVDDTGLKLSWDHKIETVPTVLRIERGEEKARAVGWHREEWESLTRVKGLGPDLPVQRPGCGSLTTDPNIADELALKFGNFKFKSRKVEIGAYEDDYEAAFDRDWSDGLPVVPPNASHTRSSARCRRTISRARSRKWRSTPSWPVAGRTTCRCCWRRWKPCWTTRSACTA